MAYYNAAEANRREKAKQKYEELKNFCCEVDESQKLSEWFLALDHMHEMEITIEKQEKELKKYREFFSLLDKLLPKSFSVYDKIQ